MGVVRIVVVKEELGADRVGTVVRGVESKYGNVGTTMDDNRMTTKEFALVDFWTVAIRNDVGVL